MDANDAALLAGATVQKVDLTADLAVLHARSPGRTSFVIVAANATGPAVGVLDHKPFKGSGLPGESVPIGEKLRWRARLDGAKIEAIEARRIVLRKDEARLVISIAAQGGSGRLSLREAKGDEEKSGEIAKAADLETWLTRGETLCHSLGEGAIDARRHALVRALAKATARVERRITAVRGDLSRIAEADRIAAQAASFVAAASRAPRGAKSLTVTDWSTGEPQESTIPLDPARTAREQIDAMFKRARRLKQGAVIGEKRLAEAEAAQQRLAAIAARAAETAAIADLDALAGEARAAAPKDFALGSSSPARAGGGAKKEVESRPYRLFRGPANARILVGRGAAHNDALTLKVARPHDLWLHAKGRAGAHVIVPLDKGQTCPAELLVDAAHLAAHFSDGREEGVIEIEYTPRRHLRKPKGSAPGFVIVDREKVIVLRVERARVERLLAAEES